MSLTLVARLRNARQLRTPFHSMSPALRCMALIAEYRELRLTARGDDDWAASLADSSMKYVAAEFASTREEMRRGFDVRLLERLADNPIGLVA